jgi:hypothetical protein
VKRWFSFVITVLLVVTVWAGFAFAEGKKAGSAANQGKGAGNVLYVCKCGADLKKI